MKTQEHHYDFSAVHQSLDSYVHRGILPGVSSAVLLGQDVVDVYHTGYAELETQMPLAEHHLFRIFSNSKLITSIAIMQLIEAGKLGLDDAIEIYLPQLGHRQVLRPGAKRLDDTEPAHSPITIRHLLSHQSGLSYGLLDHGSMIYNAYLERKVMHAHQTLAQMIDALEPLPLIFHPGAGWEYSIASDVLGHVVELISGQRFDAYLQTHIFHPLGMSDTGFVVPQEQQHRLTGIYAGSDPGNVLGRGLKRLNKAPYQDAFLKPFPRLSGGGGLVSSLADMITLVRSLIPGGPRVLTAETIALMMSNQLSATQTINFVGLGTVPGKGFGLGGAVTLTPSPTDPAHSAGEFEWGGIAGTHWWISPKNNLAGILMTQRQMSFWHPFSFDFKRLAYEAVLG